MTLDAAAYRARFVALWDRSAAKGCASRSAEVFEALLEHYAEPHRHYHTLDHIGHCLKQFDHAGALMDDPDCVELAIWFHDAIYECGADDNEQRSADWLAELSHEQLPPALRDKICALIMITRHCDPPHSRDERFIVDIDLSGFGLPWREFKRDSDAVRREFPDTTDSEYLAGKQRFLRMLLARPNFCYTSFFRARHEVRARQNIQRVLQESDGAGI